MSALLNRTRNENGESEDASNPFGTDYDYQPSSPSRGAPGQAADIGGVGAGGGGAAPPLSADDRRLAAQRRPFGSGLPGAEEDPETPPSQQQRRASGNLRGAQTGSAQFHEDEQFQTGEDQSFARHSWGSSGSAFRNHDIRIGDLAFIALGLVQCVVIVLEFLEHVL